MAIVRRKPRNSSLRFQTFVDNSDITTSKPERSLVKGLKRNPVEEMLMVESHAVIEAVVRHENIVLLIFVVAIKI